MMKTRTALLSALLRLLTERPFEQITLREITKTAGIGYATFFRHYPDKKVLLNDLAADQIKELLALAVPILFAIDSRAAATALCTYVDTHRKLWSALLAGGAVGTMREEFVRQAKEIAAGSPNHDSWLPGDLSVVYAVGGTIDVLAWWLRESPYLSIDRIAEILDRLVIAPTLPPK
jgi:AcrR family transcriptional regulator